METASLFRLGNRNFIHDFHHYLLVKQIENLLTFRVRQYYHHFSTADIENLVANFTYMLKYENEERGYQFFPVSLL